MADEWPARCLRCGGPVKAEVSGDYRHVVVQCLNYACCDGYPLMVLELSPDAIKALREGMPDVDPLP
jgi:hypothetical protein